MPGRLYAVALATGLSFASAALAAQPAVQPPPPTPVPVIAPPPAPSQSLAQVPEPLTARLEAPETPASRPAATPPSNERVDALMRALYLLSTGGTGRPYPLIPQD